MRADTEIAQQETDAARSLLMRAAVCGLFDPAALIEQNKGDAEFQKALPDFARLCREDSFEGKSGWVLLPAERRRIFSQMHIDQAEKFVRETEKIVLGDRFGTFLRQALLGKEVKTSKLSSQDLEALHTALEFVAIIDADKGNEARAIRRQLAREEAVNALRIVAPDKLFGRDDQYDALLQFMREETVPTEFCRAEECSPLEDIAPSMTPALLVSGVGGSGKSALLSTFAYKTRRWPGSPPLILLDFDRPIFTNGDMHELTFEFTRQLGMRLRDIDARLSKFRAEIRKFSGVSSDDDDQTFEGVQSAVDSSFSLLRQIVEETGIGDKPLVLILDTFEEMLVRGETVTSNIFDWLDELKTIAGFDQLRVIISGRAAPNRDWHRIGNRFVGHIELGDLDKKPAIAFLSGLGTKRAIAKQVFETYGGNPLVLLIFYRFSKNKSEVEIQKLIEDGRQSEGALTGEMAQGFLYDRILLRIHDERVRALAHPGLVLRRVTVDLIANVLRETCDLGNEEDFNSQDLFERLSDQVWLITPQPDGSVHHRRDLRRLMLPNILNNKKDQAREINARARDYYLALNDRTMSPNQQRIEATYHGLFLDNPELPDEEFAVQVVDAIGADIEDLPLVARANLKVRGGLGREMTDEEREALTGEAFTTAARIQQRAYTKAGAHQKARDISLNLGSRLSGNDGSFSDLLKKEFSSSTPSTVSETSKRVATEDVTSAFNACDLQALAEMSGPVLETLIPFLKGELKDRPNQNFLFSDWWRCALALGATNARPDSWDDIASSFLAFAQTRIRQSTEPYVSGQTLRRLALPLFVAAAVGDREICSQMFTRIRYLFPVKGNQKSQLWFISTDLRHMDSFRFLKAAASASPPWDTPDFKKVYAVQFRLFCNEFYQAAHHQLEKGHEEKPRDRWKLEYAAEVRYMGEPTLAAFDKLYSDLSEAYVYYKKDSPDWGSGTLPEIHPPLRTALEEATADGLFVPDLIAVLREKAMCWPKELTDLEKADERTIIRWLPSIIQTCDRCGLLENLLVEATNRKPDNTRLIAARALIGNYERLLGTPEA